MMVQNCSAIADTLTNDAFVVCLTILLSRNIRGSVVKTTD